MRSVVTKVLLLLACVVSMLMAVSAAQDMDKRAFHFFRIRRGSECIPVLKLIREALKNPDRICESDLTELTRTTY
ncbi:hypothetical protein D915_000435 [Fasciola hepatica]|uniref:Uncharacterized protein n=1 Tax=Fasciola hepatica TaxID=6192 RepID=A0A2H1CW52_FASHE|nr:hypothetical protein D915_000435 [Fasciola hepatica]